MEQKVLEKLLAAQQRITEKVAAAKSLAECLNEVCLSIEQALAHNGGKSSILLLRGNNLFHGSAPSLPAEYCEAINGVEIGAEVGSCGTAAFLKKQIIVSDIATDPLWNDYKGVALPHDLVACWSTPILSVQGQVLGTFAIYYPEVRLPEDEDLKLISHFTDLSRIAIEREHAFAREAALLSQLKASNEKLKAFISVIPDLGLILDEDGKYVDIYGGNEDLLVETRAFLLGKNIRDVIEEETANELISAIQNAIRKSDLELIEYTLDVQGGKHRVFEGRICPINHYLPEQADKNHVLWIARDITDNKDAEANIERLAYFDPLTGLPNRRMLNERLTSTVERVGSSDLIGALLFLDLDNFKRINDSLGHAVGDQLLVKIADYLKPVINVNTTLARVGGDEFVVLYESASNKLETAQREVSELAERLLGVFAESLTLLDAHYVVRASVGICMIHEPSTASEILKRADSAMYKAKKAGGSRFAFFDPELQKVADLQLKIEREIEASIAHDEFRTYFQPQIDMDGNLVGAEALVRWFHPEEGIVSPVYFIPIAEQTGAIHRIQETVLKQSCELILALNEEGLTGEKCTLAINISACQFEVDLEQRIKNVIDGYGLPTSRFKLEITESMLMENLEQVIEKMNSLRDKGFHFSIDDFGTGYSSLAYLHTFPIDELKIDRSFVDQMEDKGTAIIDAIISLSDSFGLKVVAEGVETNEQLDILKTKNVATVQGYYFAKPMPAEEFVEWVKSAKREAE